MQPARHSRLSPRWVIILFSESGAVMNASIRIDPAGVIHPPHLADDRIVSHVLAGWA